MKKKFIIAGMAIVMSVLLVLITSYNIDAAENKLEHTDIGDECKSIVEILTGSPNEIRVVEEDGLYEEMFNENLYTLEKKGYIFLFENESRVKAVIKMDDVAEIRVFDANLSCDGISEKAREFACIVEPNFFNSFDFDTFVKKYGDDEYSVYSVELWQKYEDGFYSGNKLAMMMDIDGTLKSYVSVFNDPNNMGASLVDIPCISAENAIECAYNSLQEVVKNLEHQEVVYVNANEQKDCDDFIETDAGNIISLDEPINLPEYNILIENRNEHDVATYDIIKDGIRCRLVNICGVRTNRLWEMGFQVAINAESGEIISIDYTR